MTIKCKNEELILCKERAIYWPSQKMLILSDLHIGKSAYFRKSGIQMPLSIAHSDLERIDQMISVYPTDNILVTGDMFHNYMNTDVDDFSQWRAKHAAIKFTLVKGNHDKLKLADYQRLNIEVKEKEYLRKPFRFIHEQPQVNDEYYSLTGHIHPGITLFGKARQRMSLACFHFGEHYATLPAFSVFTGLSLINPKEGERTFAITPSRVIEV